MEALNVTDITERFRIANLRCASGHIGVKRAGNTDAALFALSEPAVCAGVFTTNRFRSACVESASERLRAGRHVQAVLITSGNANAGTGAAGREDTELLCAEVGAQLGCEADEVIALKTGVIGVPLRAQRLLPQLRPLISGLASSAAAVEGAARAMMTTDTVPKIAVRKVNAGGVRGVIAGVAKGAGMIHPRLATMLSVLFTDFAVSRDQLQTALTEAVRTSFNAISVDGDTSPNDTVLLLSTGAAGELPEVVDGVSGLAVFQEELRGVCEDLAQQIVRDGEGATKFLELQIAGAESSLDADRAAVAVATSPLVKTAFFGEDFNPGRIVSAIGRSGAAMDPARLTLAIGGLSVYADGRFLPVDAEQAAAVMRRHDIVIEADLGVGSARCRFFTCDLTYDYVRINGEYTT